MKQSFFNLTERAKFFEENWIKSFRVKQIEHEIFHNSIIDFSEMTSLPLDLRDTLNNNFTILPFEVDWVYDGEESCKIWFKLDNWAIVESVLMYHEHTDESWESYLNRLTLCISTQVWCPVWCIFCVTWKLGFWKNLELWEVIGQVIWANNFIKKKFWKKPDWTRWAVRNIVFMWMGEPLLNYDVMKESIWYFLSQQWFWLSKRHVTISTSWIVPGIKRLITEWIDVRLALSLHAPNQELREKLIPTISKVYTLDKLMASIDEYVLATNNRIFYEYIMIDGMTDMPELARELVHLLQDRLAHVNLIPYNPNPAMPDLKESKHQIIQDFARICRAWWLTVTVRDNHARDQKWACWQLGYEKVTNNEKYTRTK